jgi:hypothetical protein
MLLLLAGLFVLVTSPLWFALLFHSYWRELKQTPSKKAYAIYVVIETLLLAIATVMVLSFFSGGWRELP